MRQYRTYIILLVALAAVAAYFWLSDKRGTMRVQNNYFAVKDTSEVTGIRILRGADTLLLQKLNNNWIVNGKYNARTKLMHQLLGLVSLIEVNTPAPKALKNDLISLYTKQPLQVIFYKGNKKPQTLRIVESDSLIRSSVMFTEEENDPYLVKIPGFNGRLSLLFPTNPFLFRDKTIFRYQPYEILYVKVEYPSEPSKSFILNVADPSHIVLQQLNGKGQKQVSKEKAVQYMTSFSNVGFEFIREAQPFRMADSLSRIQPACIIEVKNVVNQVNQIRTYPIAVKGKGASFDLYKMYAVIQNDSIPVTVKYTDFDPIMKEFGSFSVQ
ncbi:MAG TPA: hypothetical protein VHO72_00040 [Bacteroidales bacterium]|nr:hypothetical protein [Bacteroidales bacterium]